MIFGSWSWGTEWTAEIDPSGRPHIYTTFLGHQLVKFSHLKYDDVETKASIKLWGRDHIIFTHLLVTKVNKFISSFENIYIYIYKISISIVSINENE